MVFSCFLNSFPTDPIDPSPCCSPPRVVELLGHYSSNTAFPVSTSSMRGAFVQPWTCRLGQPDRQNPRAAMSPKQLRMVLRSSMAWMEIGHCHDGKQNGKQLCHYWNSKCPLELKPHPPIQELELCTNTVHRECYETHLNLWSYLSNTLWVHLGQENEADYIQVLAHRVYTPESAAGAAALKSPCSERQSTTCSEPEPCAAHAERLQRVQLLVHPTSPKMIHGRALR